MNKKIAIMGAGSWGTALAIILTKKNDVLLWCYEKEVADEIELNRTNKDFLANVELPENIIPITDIEKIKNVDIIINTIPTQFIRSVYSQVKFPIDNKIFINGAKGIEKESLKTIFEVFNEILNVSSDNYVSLTGPSHAEEVSKNVPTAVVAASRNIDLAKYIRDLITTESFRVYSSDDIIGCELGGALKNVIAIAFGIAEVLDFGDNTKAMLITRGLVEMSRLGAIFGANKNTFSGLSGLGDLVVTCNSKYSRNKTVGKLLGNGVSVDDIINRNKMVAEGIETTKSIYLLSKKMEIELPITEQVYNIIYNGLSASQAVLNLLSRETKDEMW